MTTVQNNKRKPTDYSKGMIYQIVNSVNDKVYIGSCATELRFRLYQHKSTSKNTKYHSRIFYKELFNNLDKYKIILIENFPCKSKKELEKREYEVLKEKINELGVEKVYNICLSQSGEGHHLYQKPLPNEIKQKISQSTTGEKAYWFGKHHSEETKQKLSEKKKGENHPNFGKHHSEEIKQKISQSNKFKNRGLKGGKKSFGSISENDDRKRYSFSWRIYEDDILQRKSKTFYYNTFGSKENAYKACLEFQKVIYPDFL